MKTATSRRLQQELGFECALDFVYKFEYHADFAGKGAEHELCWVYVGTAPTESVRANASEIEATRFMAPAELDREMAEHPDYFTPWIKLEWRRLRSEFNHVIP